MKASSNINVVSWCVLCALVQVGRSPVFVFNVMQPPPAIKPCNLDVSGDRFRLSKLSLGEAKGPRLVFRNPKHKICQSWLGVWFVMLRRWSVVTLGSTFQNVHTWSTRWPLSGLKTLCLSVVTWRNHAL